MLHLFRYDHNLMNSPEWLIHIQSEDYDMSQKTSSHPLPHDTLKVIKQPIKKHEQQFHRKCVLTLIKSVFLVLFCDLFDFMPY